MAKRSALGKGLGAFFGDDVVREADEKRSSSHSEDMDSLHAEKEDVNPEERTIVLRNRRKNPGENKETEENVSRETSIKITQIEPNGEQPRKKFDEESLQELADSMKEYGILQPLLVKKTGDMYQIIAGERRWRAAKLAGIKGVPVIIREYDRQQSVEIALIENVQRADLNPIEEAMAYHQLMQEFGMKQEEIASRVSKNRVTITNSIRLLKLPESISYGSFPAFSGIPFSISLDSFHFLQYLSQLCPSPVETAFYGSLRDSKYSGDLAHLKALQIVHHQNHTVLRRKHGQSLV